MNKREEWMTNPAGVDCGSSGEYKIVYCNSSDKLVFVTTDAAGLPAIIEDMKLARVTHLRVVGARDLPLDISQTIPVYRPPISRIIDELATQVRGASHLLDDQHKLRGEFDLISIGSGTSWCRTLNGKLLTPLIGNANGGFKRDLFCDAMGVSRELLCSPLEGLSDEDHLDTLVEHIDPVQKGTFGGKLVAVYFGRHWFMASPEQVALTVLHNTAVDIARDFFVLKMAGQMLPANVAFIGSPISFYPRLCQYLTGYMTLLGVSTYLPVHAQYAAALGAALEMD